MEPGELQFAMNGKIAGIIGVMDTVKPSSKKAIEGFKAMGIEVIMLTGDNNLVAQAIRKTLNIDSLADAFDDFRNYLEFRPEKICSSKSNSNDNGNNNGNSDNTNNENNNNSNLQGSDSDSSLFITMSFSVLISFFVL